MAGASMNDIKSRIKSVQGTMQITKAMELVATSKLRQAKLRAERTLPYMRQLLSLMNSITSASELRDSVWCQSSDAGKTLFIVIAGDRGLAGGYNSNITKLLRSIAPEGSSVFLPVGKKARDFIARHGYECPLGAIDYVADASVGDCMTLATGICEAYTGGDITRVVLLYTDFVSMMVQTPKVSELLPLGNSADEKDAPSPIFEGDPSLMMDKILPLYLGGALHSAIASAYASECASRRTAMNSANKNAEEMIGELTLKFNRARQAVITQEITEIVSGAEAL
ncbi:MAG: ATP synthase F1 subunit gamma [Clostridia bacterium]|nr:ATP synthase F1 subunit gamma [Clostridia bacterium]